MINYQFVLARGPSSYLILLAGGGTTRLGFSHVDVVLPAPWSKDPKKPDLFGARSDEIGGKPAGVQRRPWGYGDADWIRRVTVSLKSTPKQDKLFYDFLFAQEGKPYDKLAILAFLDDRDWREDDAWFCDEMAAAATEKAGLIPPLYLPANRLNPTGWAVALSAIGALFKSETVCAAT